TSHHAQLRLPHGRAHLRALLCCPLETLGEGKRSEDTRQGQFNKEIQMTNITRFLLAGMIGVAAAFSGSTLAQQQPPVKNIGLVHGAFADGSCWAKVIPILEARGFHVVAVQNPLASLSSDANATRRIIAMQDGPVILVGHSWGGAVITEA